MHRSAGPQCAFVAGVTLMLGLGGCGGGSVSPPPPPSFTLSASPANPSIGQGGTGTSTVTVHGQNGFSDRVNLSVTGIPAGVTASFDPASTTNTSLLTLSVDSSVTTGSVALTVTGTAGSLSPKTPLNLTVAAPSVAVALAPKRAAVAASTQTQQFTATVTGNMGDTNVTWSVDGVPGGNATAGTVDASGLYTPPTAAGAHTVTATSVAVSSSSGSASVAITDLAGVLTYHNNLSRDGTNTKEYALTSSTVTTATFGKLFSCQVDGAVYTQPLWVPGLNIGGGIHNVIFVATQHDSLYAFDADANPCVKYLKVNLLDSAHSGTPGEKPVPWADVGYGYQDIQPEIGVTGTPVIDPATSTIYIVSKSENTTTKTFYQRLHALDLTTGNEQLNSPELIAAIVPGIGDGSSGGMVAFDPGLEHQRSGLAMSGGKVFIAWAAHEDRSPYHGWLMAYNAANVQLQTGVYNTTPNGGLGGIWSGGGAPAIDSGGDLYVATGNGIFDANVTTTPNNDFGDSLLRLGSGSLALVDWFTPDNQDLLSQWDADLGSGAIVLLPNQTSGPVAHLLVEVGKEGVVYLVDRDSMGHFQPTSNSQIVQSFGTSNGMWGTPAFWQNALYFGAAGGPLNRFTFDPSAGQFVTNASSQSSQAFNYPGASPSISSKGATNGILWAIDQSQYDVPSSKGPAVLHAYDATNLTLEYWNSTMAANTRDKAGNAVKFVPPTIANGKVYVSTRTEIDVYGLLPN